MSPLTRLGISISLSISSLSIGDVGFGLRAGISALGMHLGEIDGYMSEKWEVQSIKPNHGLCALIAMVVPVPGGS